MRTNSTQIKESRFNIRANAHQKEVILRAAQLRNTSISNFVLEKAYEDAQSILAEESHFKLSQQEWQKFCKILDRPPKNILALKKLLTQPDIFDQK